MPTQYGSLPFSEQIDYFRSKTNVTTERWADMWKEAHNRSFTVAGALRDDMLADFRKAVDKAISEGKSLNWFKSQFNQIVKQYGWEHKGQADWRAQVIYETNLRQSYSAGREQQIEALKGSRPYGIYKHSGSEHPRLDHLSWNNLVIPLDDPWWKTHTPINGYGCKCKKLTASKRTLERLGLEVTGAPNVEYYDWVDKVTGEVHKVPKGIDPGFDYTPKTSAQLTKKVQEAVDAKPTLADRLPVRVVDDAYSTVKGISAQGLSDLLSSLGNESVASLQAFMKRYEMKTLFLKAGELNGSKKAATIAGEVESYLQSGVRMPMANYYTRNVSRTNGFTAKSWSHVVIKAKSTDSFKSVDASQIELAIERILKGGATPWSFSSSVREEMKSNAAGVALTWAHEIGHQVYYKAGKPVLSEALLSQAITQYSKTNADEWFAEHYVAWLFSPKALQQSKPDVYDFIQQVTESVR
ncbi:phage minor head protein [Vibrio parahaemolyticus]|uniref:phage minor head protein n=1 Tax=Vibrio parahaemolyticus TaxID=670 RepID=UPI002554CC0C|nr:phage minor head protein [Vibrio parahaemolyticus]MDK9520151.1 phage minor head protein [Vibrio parahaemolyticus]